MFGEIALVRVDQIREHLVDCFVIMLHVPGLNRLGHTAHRKVLLQLFRKLVGKQVRDRHRLIDAVAVIVEIGRTRSAQKLRKRCRPHIAKRHLANGKGLFAAG